MSKMFFLLLDRLFSLYLFSSFWLLNYFQMYSFLEWWILVVKSKNKTTVTLSFWAGLILHQIFWACGIVSANFLLRVNSEFVAFPSPSGILQTQNSYIQLRLKCLYSDIKIVQLHVSDICFPIFMPWSFILASTIIRSSIECYLQAAENCFGNRWTSFSC